MIELADADLQEAIDGGEFSDKILKSHERVAVILTQGWCPQWKMMSLWLKKMDEEVKIYFVEYEKRDIYRSFMTFKESVYGNDQVPYIRFYVDGKLTGASNYCNKEFFLEKLGL
ncbi:MAG: hypothetical protein PQJ59_04480 [Spirochaetales bacterium]|nr:hypothetical protein [Spirochaetales bacterium]